ncbi:MAG: NAD(P)-binding domain-containing protein [Dissulfurimicrobium sp.]|uniref:NAD(P)-binding domain-containing protein n=1 Tax=Dissulfurimicrobium sp. TaxID=2022436 RepID=UPI004049E03C
MEETKIVVIGAGPAGIATAVEAINTGISQVIVLEKTDHACDTIVSLFHEGKRVDPIYRKMKIEPTGKLSFNTETREEFLARIEKVIEENHLDIRYKNEAKKVSQENGVFHVFTGGGLEIKANIVVVAIGIFGKPIKPHYPIAKEIKDKVFFSLPKTPVTGKKVLVVGGGDSAAEAACFLSGANDVSLSYRRPEFFRLNDINACNINNLASNGKINLMLATDIEGLEDAGGKGVKVHFKDGNDMVFDMVFYCLGGVTPRGFLESIGVKFKGERPIIDSYGETNVKKIFLAGDLMVEKGSIMAAFNSGKTVIDGILRRYRDLVK